MPKVSERLLLLEDLKSRVQHRLLFRQYRDAIGESDKDEDHIDDLIIFAYLQVRRARYIERGPYRNENVCVFTRDLQEHPPGGGKPWLNDSEFQEKYRMSRIAFHAICDLIRNHPVFSEKRISGRKQAPVEHQLMILLFYLGVEGNGASNHKVRSGFSIGRGTAQKYRARATKALWSLRNQAIAWPQADERQAIAARIEREYKFKHCVGFVDGTLFPLAFEPQTRDAPDYSGRKYGYSLSTIIVCDDQRLIRYYLTGWPGCTHDNRI